MIEILAILVLGYYGLTGLIALFDTLIGVK